MDEEIIIEQEFIDQAKAEIEKNPALQPCKLCYHYEKCHKTKGIMQYNYGGKCFVTNEQVLRALLLQEKKRSLKAKAKFTEKLDVMNIMIGGADMIREDVMAMLEAEYKRLDIKGKNDDEIYRKSKRNMERLNKCYSKMKFLMQDFESEYRRFIEYWNAQMFADDNGAYNEEYDKHTHNIGFCTYLFFAIYDKMYMSNKNVEDLVEVMNGMSGRDVLEESDLKRYLIKI